MSENDLKLEFDVDSVLDVPQFEGSSFPYPNPIIILCKTGIFWQQQSGHHGCDQCVAEGFVVPFFGKCHYLCDWIQWYPDDKKDEEINKIDSSLEEWDEKYQLVKKVRFDRERKSEFIEGWIPVNVWLGDCLEPKKGILALGNCD